MNGGGIGIVLDAASPLLARVKTAAQASGLALVGARAGGNLVREHLIALNAQRHRKGRNFYLQAARSVGTAVAPQGAAITITHRGIRQRLKGGTIRPKPGGKFIAFPDADAPAQAFQMRPSEWPDNDLDLGRAVNSRGQMQWALIRRASTAIKFARRKRRDGSIKTTIKVKEVRNAQVIYWLASKVTQRADPSVLPTTFELAAAVINAMNVRIERAKGGAAS